MLNKGVSLNDFKQKIESIIKIMNPDIPFTVLISTSDDIYRKPNIGMWNYLIKCCNDNKEIDFKNSFFVGDAAGRDSYIFNGKKYKKDHSCSDRLFAMNIGLKHYTPEEHFFGQPIDHVKYHLPAFNPHSFVKNLLMDEFPDYENVINSIVSDKTRQIIILVGYPGSGKSYIASNTMNRLKSQSLNKVHVNVINMDTLKTRAKCEKMCQSLLSNKSIRESSSAAENESPPYHQVIIVDNTNPDRKARKPFIELAQKYNCSNIKCIWVDTPFDQCLHNEKYRRILRYCLKHWKMIKEIFETVVDEKDASKFLKLREKLIISQHSNIPEMAFRMFKSKFEEPNTEEGITEIFKTNFVPNFHSQFEKYLYGFYL